MGVGLQGPVYEVVFISRSAGVALATGDALISELGVPGGALCVGFSFPFADCNQEPDVSVHLSLSLVPNAVIHLVRFIC